MQSVTTKELSGERLKRQKIANDEKEEEIINEEPEAQTLSTDANLKRKITDNPFIASKLQRLAIERKQDLIAKLIALR
jgi:hypothetical protein